MPIIYRKGDVVEAFKCGEIDVLVHGVNAQGKMNSGIAKQIRAEFPQAYNNYRASFFDVPDNVKLVSSDLLGYVQYVKLGDKFIINAFTQDNYGYNGEQFCSYDAINEVMFEIHKDLKKNKYGGEIRIAMPKIGAGLGGGDWKVIEAIINSHFTDRDIYVYEL